MCIRVDQQILFRNAGSSKVLENPGMKFPDAFRVIFFILIFAWSGGVAAYSLISAVDLYVCWVVHEALIPKLA